jgi:hypothetical protein
METSMPQAYTMEKIGCLYIQQYANFNCATDQTAFIDRETFYRQDRKQLTLAEIDAK